LGGGASRFTFSLRQNTGSALNILRPGGDLLAAGSVPSLLHTDSGVVIDGKRQVSSLSLTLDRVNFRPMAPTRPMEVPLPACPAMITTEPLPPIAASSESAAISPSAS